MSAGNTASERAPDTRQVNTMHHDPFLVVMTLLINVDVFLLHRDLPDNPTKHWNPAHIMMHVKRTIQKAEIHRVSAM